MSEQVQKILFQSFAQADASTTRKFGGTGLGLAICRKLVELMNGSISVTSSVGQGSTFRFDLPFSRQQLQEMLGTNQVSQLEAAKRVDSNSLRVMPIDLHILLAEDNKINQMVAVKQLNRLGCTKVDVVESGIEAVKARQKDNYNLILMDCQMPEIDGYLATQQIREWERSQNLTRVLIIAMTANAMQGDRELCLAAGMDDYLAKPINTNELKNVIERTTLEFVTL